MEINNRFAIITYVGSEPLNLMAKDASISGNPIKTEQWDKMIQAIDSIYASQIVGGNRANTVPVFWTERASTVDSFGNTSFSYISSPDSTLRSLSSKSSYYFILRDISSVPIKIPSNGSIVLGYSSDDDLPLVFPSLPDTILKESFKYEFKPSIINLKPFESYSYSWEVISSNWPVAINSRTGILRPASNTGTINTALSFCPSTGDCSESMLSYTLPAECSIEDLENPYVTLRLSVKTLSDGNTLKESLSDQFTVTCDDCLPKPKISITSIGSNDIVESTDDDAPNPSYRFLLEFENLKNEENYTYSINTVYSEWPIVFSSATSGSFDARQSQAPIFGTIFFCPTTGLCIPNNDTIPPYTVPNYPKFLTGDLLYNIVLQASLSGTNSCDSSVFYSDLRPITYKRA